MHCSERWVLAALCAGLGPQTVHSQGDNVLILVADDLGVDNVGAYGVGTTPPPTPNIDALAARGVLFRNAWAYPVRSSARACIATGRYGFRTGIGATVAASTPPAVLQLDEYTLPEVLDRGHSGYAHAEIGKWHLGTVVGPITPNASGWSHYAGLLRGQAGYFAWGRTVDGVTAPSHTYSTTQIVDDALDWIGRQSGPWVCCVMFLAPHAPFHVPPAHLHTRAVTGIWAPPADPRPYFEAMVEAMDTEIGRLLAGLGPALAHTDVFFTADNGSYAATILPPFPQNHGKAQPYEGGVQVPMIVAGPAVASAGREDGALVAVVDLFATVAELAGVDARSAVPPWVRLDSRSFVPRLTDPGSASGRQRETLFAELFFGNNYASTTANGFATIRGPRCKLIRWYSAHSGGHETAGGTGYLRDELYDLSRDPFEQNDLLLGTLGPEQAAAYAKLEDALTRLRNPTGARGEFGEAFCAGSNGRPTIGGRGTPVLGGSYDVDLVAGPTSSMSALLTGSSDSLWRGARLPINLARVGSGPGCMLWVAPEISTPAATDANGHGSVSNLVPNNRALVGEEFYHSWLALDPHAPNNTLGVTTSNAAAVVVGF